MRRVRALRPSETLLHDHSLMPRVRMPCRDKMKALHRVLPLSIFRIILHLLSLAHQARFALVNQKKRCAACTFRGSESILYSLCLTPRVRLPWLTKQKDVRRVLALQAQEISLHSLSLTPRVRLPWSAKKKASHRVLALILGKRGTYDIFMFNNSWSCQMPMQPQPDRPVSPPGYNPLFALHILP